MKNDQIAIMTDSFEGHAQQTENGIEYWLARDLQHLLGYAEWRNFLNIVSKAKTACELSEHPIPDHFVEINKMVELGSGSQRETNRLVPTLLRGNAYCVPRISSPEFPEFPPEFPREPVRREPDPTQNHQWLLRPMHCP